MNENMILRNSNSQNQVELNHHVVMNYENHIRPFKLSYTITGENVMDLVGELTTVQTRLNSARHRRNVTRTISQNDVIMRVCVTSVVPHRHLRKISLRCPTGEDTMVCDYISMPYILACWSQDFICNRQRLAGSNLLIGPGSYRSMHLNHYHRRFEFSSLGRLLQYCSE